MLQPPVPPRFIRVGAAGGSRQRENSRRELGKITTNNVPRLGRVGQMGNGYRRLQYELTWPDCQDFCGEITGIEESGEKETQTGEESGNEFNGLRLKLPEVDGIFLFWIAK